MSKKIMVNAEKLYEEMRLDIEMCAVRLARNIKDDGDGGEAQDTANRILILWKYVDNMAVRKYV